MKKILITGANSFIGQSFEEYMQQYKDAYQVQTLDMIGDGWREKELSGYDVIFHVAGIVHQKETDENRDLYYKVNRDLVAELAQKAKMAGVSQFVFMSTMSVYGMESGVITPDTKPVPVSHYGKSKLEAEGLLQQMQDQNFTVSILRPPMVYGKGCPGNFQMLLTLVRKSPIFPAIKNRRSMIFIENLSAFVHLVIEKKCAGVFFPQNRECANTTEIAMVMAKILQRKVFFSHLAGLGVKMLIPFVGKAKKAFSTLIYQDCEQFDYCYCKEDLESSVRKSI